MRIIQQQNQEENFQYYPSWKIYKSKELRSKDFTMYQQETPFFSYFETTNDRQMDDNEVQTTQSLPITSLTNYYRSLTTNS